MRLSRLLSWLRHWLQDCQLQDCQLQDCELQDCQLQHSQLQAVFHLSLEGVVISQRAFMGLNTCPRLEKLHVDMNIWDELCD